MDPDSLVTSQKKAPRKVRFAPKAPPKRDQKPILPKVEKTEDGIDDVKAEQLLRRLNETSWTGKSKVEKKVGPSQVAFGYGGSSKSLKSYGAPKNFNKNQGSSSKAGVVQELQKEYEEPWDYYSNYPTVHPLRRPYSGDPELLDEEEFGEDEENSAYDENETNTAETLGLLDENMEDKMVFFQLPANLPMINQSNKSEDNNENPSKGKGKTCNLEDLPAGLMGKMLVYKSGAVKLKLGDTLYDVSAGLDCVFAQDVVAINTETKQCYNVGELSNRAVITPAVDSILDSISEL